MLVTFGTKWLLTMFDNIHPGKFSGGGVNKKKIVLTLSYFGQVQKNSGFSKVMELHCLNHLSIFYIVL